LETGPQCCQSTFYPTFSQDTERVARFQREARVLASVNHSNIAAIHGLEETDSQCKNNTRLLHNTLFERRVIPSVKTFRKIIVRVMSGGITIDQDVPPSPDFAF
jgi:serine/threonine protein kinase